MRWHSVLAAGVSRSRGCFAGGGELVVDEGVPGAGLSASLLQLVKLVSLPCSKGDVVPAFGEVVGKDVASPPEVPFSGVDMMRICGTPRC